jgi:hypothetical protein
MSALQCVFGGLDTLYYTEYASQGIAAMRDAYWRTCDPHCSHRTLIVALH